MKLQGCDLKNTEKPNFFFLNCIKLYFCSCADGARSKGSCVHVCSVIMGMASGNTQRDLWKVTPSPSIDAETFPDTHISPETLLGSRQSVSNQPQSPNQPSRKRFRH